MEKPRTKLEGVLLWGARAIAILIPAIVSAYISYRQAAVETTSTQQHAAAGYDVLVNAVDKLAERMSEQAEQISYLKGRLEAAERYRMSLRSQGAQSGSSSVASGGGRRHSTPVEGRAPLPEPPPPPPPAPDLKDKAIFRKPIPKSLGAAYQMQQDNAINF